MEAVTSRYHTWPAANCKMKMSWAGVPKLYFHDIMIGIINAIEHSTYLDISSCQFEKQGGWLKEDNFLWSTSSQSNTGCFKSNVIHWNVISQLLVMLESSRKKRLKGNSMQFFEKKKNFDIMTLHYDSNMILSICLFISLSYLLFFA